MLRIFLCLVILNTANAGVVETLGELATEVTIDGDKLIVVSDEAIITNFIYETTIKYLCTDLLFDESSVLKEVSEVYVLNKHKAQGYVFESPELCETFNTKYNKILLMGNTRQY